MTTVFTKLIAENPESSLAIAFTAVMLSGLFQILFGILRFGLEKSQLKFPMRY